MPKLILGNSYSQIVGLTPSQMGQLKKLLSYDPDPQAGRYIRGGYRPKIRYLVDSKGHFPTGLLMDVFDFLTALNLDAQVSSQISAPPALPGVKATFPFTPYAAQKHAIEAAVMSHRGIISLPTGSGKSFVIAGIVAALKVKTLIVVPNVELKRQISETIRQVFGKTELVRVENIDSTALAKLKDFDCLIIDEAHHTAANTYQKLNKTAWTGIYYRFCLTATPYRNRDNEQILFRAIAGEVIYSLSYKDAIKEGYIVPVEAYYYRCEPKDTKKTVWTGVYSDLVVNNERRNLMIALLMLRLNAERKATLCLVKEVAHGKALSALTGVPFINGQDEDSREYLGMFNRGEIKCLIGTTGVIGEGVDTRPCEYVIIAGLGKAKSALLQQVGRAVRVFPGKESAKVILFQDKSHRWPAAHFKEQSKIISSEFGIMPIELVLEGEISNE